MSVYVDDLLDSPVTSKWRFGKHCHLVADTPEELHDFAEELGLRRRWYQHTTVPHYDLTASKHAMARSKGAILITREQMRDHIRKHRIVV